MFYATNGSINQSIDRLNALAKMLMLISSRVDAFYVTCSSSTMLLICIYLCDAHDVQNNDSGASLFQSHVSDAVHTVYHRPYWRRKWPIALFGVIGNYSLICMDITRVNVVIQAFADKICRKNVLHRKTRIWLFTLTFDRLIGPVIDWLIDWSIK